MLGYLCMFISIRNGFYVCIMIGMRDDEREKKRRRYRRAVKIEIE